MTTDDLYLGCRRQSSRRLSTMARRIESHTELTFDDLILPAPNKRQLEEVRHRIRLRSRVYAGLGFEKRLSLGKGLIALFTGSTGTGKTMAAELLAQEQQVDLYKVDLSAVVSKYVGETEKNLSQVFAEAEDANAIIFFDEADALFGRRGEVKEARDRWANFEVNYLLQRIEEYAGVVIMASNLRQNIDEAFLRRIHVIVDFPFPDAESRFHILQGLFPAGINRPPDEEIRLVAERFNLAGGNLKNIVIDAAFRALAEVTGETPPTITLRHLIVSTAREYQKLSKPIKQGEFSQQFYAWVEEDIL
jgi:SpoVK/Ycf46/Vps4 family AAA+-type ATPase